MRNFLFLCGAIGLLAAVSPVLLRAQFQPPDPDEFKMTSDPKAQGAAAVYLEIRESDNDPLHYKRYYARIKVLTDRGKELATVRIANVKGSADFRIADVQGRTIHSDGTVVPLAVKPEDLLVTRNAAREIEEEVFTLPSVEVGSVLEYSYEVSYDPRHFSAPIWEVQQHHFVHKAHYEFTPFKGFLPGARDQLNGYLTDASGNILDHLVWNWRLPPGVTVTEEPSVGRFSLDVTDIPPVPKEAWMPPISSMLYKVQFYYTNGSSAEDFWMQAAKTWSKDIDRFAEPTKTVQDADAGLIATPDSDLVKAQKLYTAVEALVNESYRFVFRKRGLAEVRATQTDDRNLFPGCSEFAIEHLSAHGAGMADSRNARCGCLGGWLRDEILAGVGVCRLTFCF